MSPRKLPPHQERLVAKEHLSELPLKNLYHFSLGWVVVLGLKYKSLLSPSIQNNSDFFFSEFLGFICSIWDIYELFAGYWILFFIYLFIIYFFYFKKKKKKKEEEKLGNAPFLFF